jgi:two-component system cell cycle sensor histidine kinase/response regulator CckA
MRSKSKAMALAILVLPFCIFLLTFNYVFDNADPFFYQLLNFDAKYNDIAAILAALLCSMLSLKLMQLIFRVMSTKKHTFILEILDRANDAVYVIDIETGLITFANKRSITELGMSLDEITGKKFTDIDPVARTYVWQDYQANVKNKGQLVYESKHTRPNGLEFPVEVNVTFVLQGKRPFLLALCRNITTLKQAQEWYQTIIWPARDAFFLMDTKGLFLEVNEAFCRLTGRTRLQLLSMNLSEVFDDPEKLPGHLVNIFASGSVTFECHIRSITGHTTHLEASISYLTNHGGRYFAFLRDITGRKAMEEEHAAEKERLDVTLRSIGEGVIATDTKGMTILMNPAAEKLTGWTQEEARNLPVSGVFHIIDEKTGQRYEDPIDLVLKTGEPKALPQEPILITKHRVRRIIALSGAPIIDQQHQVIGAVVVFQDKTLERQTERELLKIEKLSSLSLLAGGIAHDFNNILAAITGNITLAKALLQRGEKNVLHVLGEAEQASSRAKDLSQQLLTFAKGGTPVKELANIVPLIKESAKFASSGSTVKCEIELPENLWPTEIDPGQLSQVIHNLVINAIQAMPEGGVMRIRGENVKLNGKTRTGLPLSSGKYIKIAVEDEGVGIWPDQLGKIFDPYFTTKQKGSGLGLATVYSILHNHTGYITADSIPSKGTTFTFYLPAYKAQVTHATKAPETLHEGTGKVLVMDDEAMIRENMGEILGLLGYSADFAEDGAKAVELYRNAQDAGEPYEVVITDLTIPGGMGGKETIQKLQELDPQVKAIVFSGYADDPILSHHTEFGFKGFIKKPYTINDVSESLHRVVSQGVVAESAAFSGEAAAEGL